MIELTTGNVLEADVEALVNTVNCVGVMGKGIALQFKRAYPDNFLEYEKACNRDEVRTGQMFVHYTGSMYNPKYIINFPTKNHWREKSKLHYITSGLDDLVSVIEELSINSIAIPPLGSGLGGLKWENVKELIIQRLEPLEDVHVYLYEPAGAPPAEEMPVGTKKPVLTIARALLLLLMANYRTLGYTLTLLEIHKLAYFLQEAGEDLQLQYEQYPHGPYAKNLKFVLNILEGHYIRGCGDNQQPMKPIRLLENAASDARKLITKGSDSHKHLKRVSRLIDGFQTPYGMELLSSVHWLACKSDHSAKNHEDAFEKLLEWKQKKKGLIKKYHVEVAWQQLKESSFVCT